MVSLCSLGGARVHSSLVTGKAPQACKVKGMSLGPRDDEIIYYIHFHC